MLEHELGILYKEFINNSYNFFSEKNLKLDVKHERIIKGFYKEYDKNKKFYLKNFRDWSFQDDYVVPAQLNKHQILINGFFKSFLNFILRKIYELVKPEIVNGFFDDISFLKKYTNLKILKANPAHLSPGCKKFYFIDNNISTNVRWNRYAYIASQIEKYKLLNNGQTWIDIGSYYGGLQSFVKKIFPKINIVMVDFQHQLCRSYIFLKQVFPTSNHILPNSIKNLSNLKSQTDTIVYLPINDYSKFKFKFDLFTNFFSLGEMNNKDFKYYLDNYNHHFSKKKYLINRVVSGPYFDKTYNVGTNILMYPFNNNNTEYYDVFPIQHYQLQKTKLNNKIAFRPRSSEHFEVIYR